MSQVSGRFIADLIDGVRHRGVDPHALTAGLTIDPARLRDGHPRYPWDEFVTLLERLEHAVGGPQMLEDATGGFEHITIAPVLRRIAGYAATPYRLYTVAQRWALPRVLPHLETRIDVIDRGRLRIVCRIPSEDRPCPQLLRLATGAIRSCPTLLGLPPAEVIADIQPRFGQWIVAPPASRSITARIRTAFRAALSTRAAFRQLEVQQHELQRGFEDLQAAYTRLEASEAREREYAGELERKVAERTRELERKNRDLRELQSLLLDAERMGTARDLAGRVAHSINNPLGALVAEVSLMIHDGAGDEERLHEILALADRVGDVVKRTLELYREGKIDRRPERVDALLRDLVGGVAGAAGAKRIQLSVEQEDDLPTIPVDRPLLLTALESLASNAIQSLPEAGRLEIRAEHDREANCIRIIVSDDGPGIPAEQRDWIFEPFYTTRESGTGLGLPIANGVVRGHEGELRLEESAEGGARFVVELPIKPHI